MTPSFSDHSMAESARSDRLSLAREAHERGQSLAAAGQTANALLWMERAWRLLPSDDALALALASACLGQDDARAVELFAPLAARYGSREAWTGLAISRRNLGDLAGAAEAVSRALATLVPDGTLAGIAELLVRQLAAAGWCGMSIDGVLDIHVADGHRRIELEIDGQRRRPFGVGPLGTARVALPIARWRAAHEVGVLADGMHLLGSPIEARAIRRIEGCVTSRDGALEGWAWHPADPTIDPVMTVSAASGEELTLIACDPTDAATLTTLLGRPRRFRVSSDRLRGMASPFHLRGADGVDLLGSPLDPVREQRAAVAAAGALQAKFPAGPRRARSIAAAPLAVPADIIGPVPPIGRDRRRRIPDVVVPVHGGGAMVRACLESVLATVSSPSRIIVIDDATPDRKLAAELAELARRRRIRLIRHGRNRGYPASANAGLRACAGRDVVLLNSDTIVAPSWLDRLRDIAYGAPDIGTVSPLSNNGTILSYPRRDESNAMPDAAAAAQLARQADRANRGVAVDIPIAVGFCMYLRRDCLAAVGAFREDVFAQGYGEENDFCLRARHLGWRHVAAPGVFVAHRGAQSFGPAGDALRARNQVVLNRLHPGYEALVIAHLRGDPLAQARRRLDLARWRAARPASRAAALLITHTHGGGVEQRIAVSCAAHREAGVRPIVLRPTVLADGTPGAVLGNGVADGFPNLRFALPSELPELARVLCGTGLREVELHHLLGHHPAVLELIAMLSVPYDVHVHDYALICPRITLIGRERRYCGEPAVATCEVCIADLGSVSGEAISVAGLRQRSGRLLAGARHVLAPSADTAIRLRRHFPMIEVRTVPHGDDDDLAGAPIAGRPGRGDDEDHAASIADRPARGTARICVVGAIGVEKGYEILLACARDAAERGLKLEFVVVGHTIDDARLLDTGRVFVTGEFQPAEAVPMIQAQDAALAWLPSVWPETWCFTLSEAWRAGLLVVAFDLGAQAERIRRTGRGVLLPLGLPPAAINSALLAAAGLSDHR
jgi:GT2 family glycosyltransferase